MWTKEWCPGYKPVSPSSILTEELGLYFIYKREKKANESKKTNCTSDKGRTDSFWIAFQSHVWHQFLNLLEKNSTWSLIWFVWIHSFRNQGTDYITWLSVPYYWCQSYKFNTLKGKFSSCAQWNSIPIHVDSCIKINYAGTSEAN